MNKLWTRIFLILAAMALLLFFSNDFGLIGIQETAIVVAIGIDMPDDGEGYDVTAQIAVPAASGKNSAGNVTVRNAATVGDAVAVMNQETGWYPTLVHCKLVLLGEETANEDVFNILGYFFRNDSVEDSCLVAVCSGRADETFRAQSPIKDISASAITKVLSSQAQKTGLVSVNILKNFAQGYYSVSESSFLPYITAKSEADSQGGDGGETQAFAECFSPFIKRNKRWRWKMNPLPLTAAAADSKNSSGNGQKSDQNADIFQASETMLFYRGRRAAILSPEETLAFNLAEAKTDFAYGNVTVNEDGQDVTYDLKMKIDQKKQKLTFQEGKPVFSFRIRANARVVDADRASPILDVAKTQIVKETILRAAEEKFRERLLSVCEKTAETGCDLFGLKQKLYRFCYGQYAAFKDTILQEAEIKFDIRFTSAK